MDRGEQTAVGDLGRLLAEIRNPWFEGDVNPALRSRVADLFREAESR